jgi:hypothetical protein
LKSNNVKQLKRRNSTQCYVGLEKSYSELLNLKFEFLKTFFYNVGFIRALWGKIKQIIKVLLLFANVSVAPYLIHYILGTLQ